MTRYDSVPFLWWLSIPPKEKPDEETDSAGQTLPERDAQIVALQRQVDESKAQVALQQNYIYLQNLMASFYQDVPFRQCGIDW